MASGQNGVGPGDEVKGMKQTIATRIQDALRQAGYALSNHALATRLGLRESSVRRTTRQLVEARKIARGPFSYMANRETYVSKGDGVKACSGFQLSKRKPIRVPAERGAVDEFGELATRKREALANAQHQGHQMMPWHQRTNDAYGRWQSYCYDCNRIMVVCTELPPVFAEWIYGRSTGNSMRTHMEETRDDWPGRALIITALALLDEEVLGLDDICGVHRNLNTAREKLAAWLGFVYHPATNRYHKER
jgi:hypothetical protein